MTFEDVTLGCGESVWAFQLLKCENVLFFLFYIAIITMRHFMTCPGAVGCSVPFRGLDGRMTLIRCGTVKGELRTLMNSRLLCPKMKNWQQEQETQPGQDRCYNLMRLWRLPKHQSTEITWQPFVHSEVFHFNSLKWPYSLRKPLTATVPAEAFHWSDEQTSFSLCVTQGLTRKLQLLSLSLQWLQKHLNGQNFGVCSCFVNHHGSGVISSSQSITPFHKVMLQLDGHCT